MIRVTRITQRHQKSFSCDIIRKQTTSVQVSSLKYCMDLVRQHDYENFLATLLLPGKLRSSALAIRAFNVEVARVHAQIRDVKIGEMRLQFWNDTLDVIYSGKIDRVPRNPVAIQLHKACSESKINKHHLKKLITSRRASLNLTSFATVADMEKYCDESVTPVYFAILEAAGITNVDADHAASHLGKAQGLSNMLRSIKNMAMVERVLMLPQDILLKHNLSQESVLRGVDCKELRDSTFDLACVAMQHLRKARSITVPQKARCVFLPAVPVRSYLRRLESNLFNVLSEDTRNRSAWLPAILYWYNLMSKY